MVNGWGGGWQLLSYFNFYGYTGTYGKNKLPPGISGREKREEWKEVDQRIRISYTLDTVPRFCTFTV